MDSQVSVRARGDLMERNIMSFRRERERDFPLGGNSKGSILWMPMKGWLSKKNKDNKDKKNK